MVVEMRQGGKGARSDAVGAGGPRSGPAIWPHETKKKLSVPSAEISRQQERSQCQSQLTDQKTDTAGEKRVATPPAPGHGSENNGMDLSEAKWCDAVLPCPVFWPSREIS